MKTRLFLLTLLACAGCGREPKLEGRFVGRTYTNAVFGLSVAVPAGWTIAERGQLNRTVEGSMREHPASFDKATLAKATPKATQLLWIAPPGQGERTSTYLSFTAYDVSDYPTLPSASAFAASAARFMSKEPFVNNLTGPTSVELGGRSFQRTDLIRMESDARLTQTYLFSRFDERMLIVLVSSTNADDHAHMEALFDGVALKHK